MSFSLGSFVSSALSNVNWLAEAEKGVTAAESLGPLLMKTAIDGYNAAKGSGSLLTVLQDIEADLPAAEAAFSANNSQVAPAPPAAAAEPDSEPASGAVG